MEINRQIGTSVSLGEALYELGALHRAAGRGREAVPPLREAEGIFQKAEARLDLERVRALLQEIDSG